MRFIELASTATGARSEAVIGPAVLAAVAKQAVLEVPGVLRTEPGLGDLVTAMARIARQRIRGLVPADTSGIRVVDGPDGLVVDVAVAVAGHPALVGAEVQAAIRQAVVAATGVAVHEVHVSVVDIEPWS